MKKTFRLIAFVIALTSCSRDEDFTFTPQHRQLFSSYNIGDTIFFSNSKGDYDTIFIVSLDSMEVPTGIAEGHKFIEVRIKHLPENKWNSGIVIENNAIAEVYNQELISVDKKVKNENEPETYSTHFNFRNFRGELNDMSAQQYNNIFANLGINTYWEINDYSSNDHDSSEVSKILWTYKYGLTGYYKGSADLYKIRPK